MGSWLREEQTSRIYNVEIENIKLQYPDKIKTAKTYPSALISIELGHR